VYRPTEGEAVGKTKTKPPRGKLEERAGQLEKGVGGFLKKLEKKIGWEKGLGEVRWGDVRYVGMLQWYN
jgi:hypothetical protein